MCSAWNTKGPDGASSSELHPLSLSALLVDRAIALLEVAYPADEVAFWEAVDARGGRASEEAGKEAGEGSTSTHRWCRRGRV